MSESSTSQTIKSEPLVVLFVVALLGEVAYKVFWWQGIGDVHVSQFIKLGIQLILLYLLFRKQPKAVLPLIVLFACFSLGQIGLVDTTQYLENAVFFDRYLYTLLPLMVLGVGVSTGRTHVLLDRVFLWYLGLNSLGVLIGWIGGIQLFETYSGSRFGYSGFVLRSGGATYLYWIGLFYLLTALHQGRRKLWGLFALVLVASTLLGTKTMFIGYGLLLLYLLFLSGILQKWWSWVFIGVVIILSAIAFKPLMGYFMGLSDTFAQIVEQDGLSAAIWSYRDELLLQEMWPRMEENWAWWNYLFGGAEDMHFRSQFGIFDLLFFFGVAGTVVLIGLYARYMFQRPRPATALFFLFGTLLLVGLSGNFLYETSLAFVLVVLRSSWNQLPGQ